VAAAAPEIYVERARAESNVGDAIADSARKIVLDASGGSSQPREPAMKKSGDPLRQARTSPKSVERLELLNLGLPSFPEEILACTNLKALRLAGCLSSEGDGTLPSAFTDLVKLERLCLKEEAVTELPETLGKLERLEYLELEACQFRALPASLGQLSRLKELRLIECADLRALPPSLGKLTALETLDCSAQGADKRGLGAVSNAAPAAKKKAKPE
jgi:Leucine-rich repeat (LRR) protein